MFFCDILQISYGRAYLQLLEDVGGINVETMAGADLEVIVHRVNNAYIHRLEFSCQENLHRLCHALAEVDNLQCWTGTPRIEVWVNDRFDLALIVFLGLLKPQAYETSMVGELREDYVMLFVHNALRNSVSHLLYEVSNPGKRSG